MQTRKPHGKRALLAFAIANSMLCPQLSALSENTSEAADLVVNQIAQSKTIVPEMRAYWLLRLTEDYLKGMDKIVLDAQFKRIATTPSVNSLFKNPRMEGNLTRWADEVALAGSRQVVAPKSATSDVLARSRENTDLAHKALEKALTQIDLTPDVFTKMNLYFIASRLFQKMEDDKASKKCDSILAKTFKDCESDSEPNEALIKASLSILSSMAYSRIAVEIPDQIENLARPPAFTEQDFQECQRLKLRGLAMADRLKPGSHVRRKAHRDLVVWYFELGKADLADEEKQNLFALVGRKDEGLLYPQAGMCGHLIWWKTEVMSNLGDNCGMG